MGEPDAEGVGVAVPTAITRRGRRRANVPDDRRTKTIKIRVTEAEDAELRARAVAAGVTPQALLMRSVLAGGAVAAAAYEQLREELGLALRFLASISGNVNQLARQANTAGGGVEGVAPVTAAQLAAALDAVQRASSQVGAVAGTVVYPPAAARGRGER